MEREWNRDLHHSSVLLGGPGQEVYRRQANRQMQTVNQRARLQAKMLLAVAIGAT